MPALSVGIGRQTIATDHWCHSQITILLLPPSRRRLYDQCGSSVIWSVSRITAKVISRFHRNVVL